MSQENVELAQQAFDAFNRRDMGAFLALMDADVEAVSRLVAMEGGYHGHDGIRRWWENVHDVIPDFSLEVVEVHDLGDLTVATLRARGHGSGSDTPVEEMQWHACRWRRRKCTWWRTFRTEAEALEAARLNKKAPTDSRP
jgi:ketosteroid isomerase-like protein